MFSESIQYVLKAVQKSLKNPTAHLVYTSGHPYTDKNTGHPMS